MKEYIDVLKKWKDFDGRARRREYWMFVLFMAIFAIVASIIDAILGTILRICRYLLFGYASAYDCC